ncbi:hypothetical protein PLESTF_000837300 [Pleodorina starrii]|nr:hypothetical protein PLESTM_000271900 [Pleodorina starrii]GLC69487.1 hypothetical protein PLESTF_000837300 [Pleodorina starrii]
MLFSGRTAERPHRCLTRNELFLLDGRINTASLTSPFLSKPVLRFRSTHGRWKGRQIPFAHPGPNSSETIKSLESILGSVEGPDEDDPGPIPEEAADEYPGGPDRRRVRVPAAAERRVRPLYVYVIYYCYIVVYLATAWLQATDGDLAASTLVDGLVNDHLAVASGQIPRLATAGFVCDGPLELFLVLATLATVGAEAEALLGYSLFWAVYWLAGLGGGLADAAFSELPVTAGPANAAAGIVGALAAYYVRNLGLELRIGGARAAVRRRRRQILEGLGGGGDGSRDADKSSRQQPDRDSLEDAEAEVEVLPLVPLTFSARMSPEAKGLLNVLVALVVAGQGLLDYGGASSNASWIGLIAAFWTGLILTFGAGPQYEVQYTLPEFPQDAAATAAAAASSSSTSTSNDKDKLDITKSSSSSGGHQPTSTSPPPPPAGWQKEPFSGRGSPPEDEDGLKVVDVCPPSRRRAVLGGYVGGLAALICGWLAWMDL